MNRKIKISIWIITSIVVVTIAIVLLTTRKSGTMEFSSKGFAVQDTAAITAIFLANTTEDEVLLERTENGWELNKEYEVIGHNVTQLLGCIQNLTVRDVVSKAARENINKRMASGSTKVEIHYTDHRIKIGKLHLFKFKNKKTFYIGQSTMDNMGNFAIMEGAEVPYIIYLPGFRGFVGPKFSALPDSWRTHNIVRLRRSQIQEVKSTDVLNNNNSFSIVRNGNRHFDILNSTTNQKIIPYDTLNLLDFLSELRDLNYESMVNKISPEEKASIFKNKFKELSITDLDGNTTTITMFHLENEYNTDGLAHEIDFMESYNRDRFYAVFNGNTNEVFLCQYFVFDRLVQPLEFFVPGNTIAPIPKIYEITEE